MKEFGHGGGTIGRSMETSWPLPDSRRYLSNRHASIDYRSGSYYIIDTSTNGVYVNGADTPVGRGKPQRLFSGDKLRIGEYEMLVVIEGEEDHTREQLANPHHIDPVDLAQRVAPPEPTGEEMVREHEMTGVGIELLLEDGEAEELRRGSTSSVSFEIVEESPQPPPSPARFAPAAQTPRARERRRDWSASPAVPPTRRAADRRGAAEAAAPVSRGGRGQNGTSLLEAFYRGAGLPANALDDKAAEQVLQRLGQLMREMIVGLAENLRVRADQKTALRVPNTTIQPQNNNPLKFAATVDEALQNLLFRENGEYMPAVEAVREAFVDMKLHQQALLAAVRAGVASYVGRLDPDDLESKFSNGRRGGLMNAANKLKYWDVYKDLYQVVTQHSPNQFPPQLAEELGQAYEQELVRAAGGQRARAHAGG